MSCYIEETENYSTHVRKPILIKNTAYVTFRYKLHHFSYF